MLITIKTFGRGKGRIEGVALWVCKVTGVCKLMPVHCRRLPLSKQMADLPTSCILTATSSFLAQKNLSLYSSRLSQVIDTQNEHVHPCIFPPVCAFWRQRHTLPSLLTIYPCIFPTSIHILITDNSLSRPNLVLYSSFMYDTNLNRNPPPKKNKGLIRLTKKPFWERGESGTGARCRYNMSIIDKFLLLKPVSQCYFIGNLTNFVKCSQVICNCVMQKE